VGCVVWLNSLSLSLSRARARAASHSAGRPVRVSRVSDFQGCQGDGEGRVQEHSGACRGEIR
jgi:hypothetical protein